MAGASTVLEDGSLLSRIDTQLAKLEQFFALLSGLAVFSLMFFAVLSVGGRRFFASPMQGYVDYIEQLMPLIAFMGIAFVQRSGGHIRMDILIGQLKGRALWLAELISVILILVLITALIWGSWAHFDRSFDFSKPLWSRDSTIDVGMPVWPSKILVPIAFSVLSARLLIQIYAYSRAFILGLERPVSVPLIQTIEEQAREEAEQLEGRD